MPDLTRPPHATNPPEGGLVADALEPRTEVLAVVMMMVMMMVMVVLSLGWCSHARQQDKSNHSNERVSQSHKLLVFLTRITPGGSLCVMVMSMMMVMRGSIGRNDHDSQQCDSECA